MAEEMLKPCHREIKRDYKKLYTAPLALYEIRSSMRDL
jgi:hypothetical protein